MERSEASVEKTFYKSIEKSGYWVIKLSLLYFVGMPDRMLLGKNRFILFLEFKRRGEEPRKIQEYRINQLREWGFPAYVVDDAKEAKRIFTKEVQATQVPK